MYYVTIGESAEQVLYYPSDNEFAIFDTELYQCVGDVGTFRFKVPATNPYYNSIVEHNIITVFRDNKEYWRGFVREISMYFDKSLDVYCIEDMGFLALTNHPPVQFHIFSPAQIYEQLLKYYNSLDGIKGTSRVFEESGYINNNLSGVYIEYETTYEMTLLDCFRQLCGKEYFLKVRRKDGKRYLDCLRLENYGKSTSQDIFFGDNLLSYVRKLDTSSMLNVIHPYGDEKEDREVYEGYAERLEGTVLGKPELINKYGRIEKVVIFETDDLKTLNSEAKKYLDKYCKPHIEVELSAIDMSELSVDYENLLIGDKVQVYAEPFGYNGEDAFPIIEMTTDIQDLSNNALVLSDTMDRLKTLTQIQGEIVDELGDLPKPSAILDLARKHALAMLDNSEGGYVSFEFNEQGQIIAFHIADDLDRDKAFNEWVWNYGGLGFRTRTRTDAPWNEVRVALTRDGHIVADRMFAAEISGDNLLGGALQLGGTGYGKNGSIKIYNESGLIIMTLDKNGLTLTNGMKIKWADIKDTPTIPTKLSQLQNDKNFIVSDDIKNTYIGMDVLYYRQKKSLSKPKAPTRAVTRNDDVSDAWTKKLPSKKKGYVFWKCNQYITRAGNVSWSEVYEYVPNSVVTEITQDTVTTSYVNALNVTAATFSAQSVQGKYFYLDGNNYLDFRPSANGKLQTNVLSLGNGIVKINSDTQGYRLQAKRIDMDVNQGGGTVLTGIRDCTGSFNKLYYGKDFGQYSDERIKENIEELSVDESIKALDSFIPKRFKFKDKEVYGNDLKYGVIAQELIKELESNGFDVNESTFFDMDEKGYYTVNYVNFLPHIVNVVKEQQKQIEELKELVNKLCERRQ